MAIKKRSNSSKKHNGNEKTYGKNDQNNMYMCNICLEIAKDAVLSVCGHLFCWPCLYQWLETPTSGRVCPVCKGAISKNKVIPIYGHGNLKLEDSRNEVPPRPTAQRTQQFPFIIFPGFDSSILRDDDDNLPFVIGGVPIGFFTVINFFYDLQIPAVHQLQQDDEYLSKLFLWVAVIIIGFFLVV